MGVTFVCCRSVREEWIKIKYVERRYVKPLPTPVTEPLAAEPAKKVSFPRAFKTV